MASLRSGLVALSVLAAGPVFAADIPPRPAPQQYAIAPTPTHDIVLELGAGAQVRPTYEGSKDFEVWPTGFFELHYLRIPGYGEVKKSRIEQGWSIGPSLRYTSKRKSADYSELTGLNDVGASYEAGARVAYTFGMLRPWAALRYGFGGFSGFIGETGLDFIFQLNPATEVTIGPRASFASRDYMETYFGVTPAEAARSALTAYAPGGGFKGVGGELTTRYEFMPQWNVVGVVSYERLIGDAADSPIVQVGNENQFTFKLGITHTFGLRLFH